MASLDRIGRRLGVDLIGVQAQLYGGGSVAKAMACTPWQRGLVSVDPARPALVNGVTAATVGGVSRFLVDAYGTEADCHVLDADIEDEPATIATLGQLRSLIVDEMEAVVWVEAGDPVLCGRSAETLTRIVARLRGPDGCPWDREQTSQSLRDAITGESYEIVDAINNADDRNLAEELGDVLMTVALQAQIAEDEGRFTLADVYETVNAKLVRRHPHVFGDTVVSGTDDIVANWNRIKADEKASTGKSTAEITGPLGRYPDSMPALAIVGRLVASGDWPADVFIDPIGPADPAEETADWYARQLVAGRNPEADLRAAVRRLITAGHSLRFTNSAGERTEE